MRLHFIQHVAFEDPAHILEWASLRGVSVTSTLLFANQSLPHLDDFDFLVVMGGPMSVHDEEVFPWLVAEKQFIKKAIDNGKKVLGICLGAQLIAEVLGGTVSQNTCVEIGWYPVEFHQHDLQALTNGLQKFPPSLVCFHWHGETFSYPEKSIPIGSSAACSNQGFVYKDYVVAFQFHIETSPESLRVMLEDCEQDLVAGPYVQTAVEMQKMAIHIPALKKTLFDFLDLFFKL